MGFHAIGTDAPGLRRVGPGKTAVTSLLALLLVAVAAMWPSAAGAHLASTYYPNRWATTSKSWSFGQLSIAPYSHTFVRDQITPGAAAWQHSLANFKFTRATSTDNQNQTYTGSACSMPSPRGWALTQNSGQNGTLASASRCVSTSTPTITAFTIRFNTAYPLYVGSSSSVPSGQYDLRSLSSHEFGHATGFAGHLSGSDICTGSTRQTMCSGLPAGTSYKRSLESHDIHTFTAAY